jgi:hypothetical protein
MEDLLRDRMGPLCMVKWRKPDQRSGLDYLLRDGRVTIFHVDRDKETGIRVNRQ